jgi:hypothetical protein
MHTQFVPIGMQNIYSSPHCLVNVKNVCIKLTGVDVSVIQITNYLRRPRAKVKENIFMLLFIQLLSACVLYTINHCRHTFLGKL